METTAMKKNCVLDADSIQRKIKRMALEVAEQNADEEEIIIAGIAGNGDVVAKALKEQLERISNLKLLQITVILNKKEPLESEINIPTNFNNRVILLVDDVANTGKTMLYALKPFLKSYPKKIQTLVLVERSHKLFPLQTDFSGLSIATTLQEHITVETEGNKITGAWLY
jgi:pyrimidine operon attenuation protein/uracil phosphoribosyltransferase